MAGTIAVTLALASIRVKSVCAVVDHPLPGHLAIPRGGCAEIGEDLFAGGKAEMADHGHAVYRFGAGVGCGV